MREVSPTREVIRFSAFEVDLRGGEVRKNGFKIRLQEQPFQILRFLLEHPGKLVTREELQGQIWPADTFVDFEKGLNNAIKRLRDALGDSAERPRFIETVPKRGYRFVAPIEVTSPSETSTSRTRVGTDGREAAGRKWRMRTLAFAALAAVLLISGYVLKGRWRGKGAHELPGKVRLLVLPFQNLSGDPSQDFFSSGMTDELITQLGRLNPDRLGVIASTSSNMVRGKGISEIGRELNVQYVVAGSVRRSGNQVRVDVQLIQASDETHLWADSYTTNESDVLRVQSEVSEAVVRQIPANLHLTSLPRRSSINPRAHDAYLKGTLYLHNRSDVGKSAALFEEAIREDPNYAAAYAAAALAYITLGQAPYDVLLPRDAIRKARAAAQHALEIDPSLADAHAALGLAAGSDWDLRTAEREYRMALELDPNDAAVHEWLGIVFVVEGKAKEALEEGQRSLDLDPVSPACYAFMAQAYYYAGNYDNAIEQARHIVEIQPRFIQARYWLGNSYIQKKMYREGIEQFRLARQASNDNSAMVMGYGYAQALAGNGGEARAALRELEVRKLKHYIPAIYFAGIHLGLGDNADAMRYLDEAYEERSDRLIYFGVEPMLNPLRSDPRFKELLRRIGLPQ